MTVTFTSGLSAAGAPLTHAWEHTVGSSRCGPRAARGLAGAAPTLPRQARLPARPLHDLLDDDIGTLISPQDKPVGFVPDFEEPLAHLGDAATLDPVADQLADEGGPGLVVRRRGASCLVKEPLGFSYENRTIRFDVDLPPHAVAAVTLELAPEPSEAGEAA